MYKRVLITGGAGFIGTHLARRLVESGCEVTILDNFSPQVHANNSVLPSDLTAKVKLIKGDIRDRSSICNALTGQDAVVHFAAETGTGQSMYEIAHYESVNVGGTALLLDCIVNDKRNKVGKIVVASSRAIYGEGKYHCPNHGVVYPIGRNTVDLEHGYFEPRCPVCQGFVSMLDTDEASPFYPTSMYGLTKQVQEQMILMYARTIGISAYALRYQNVFGPGQSLHNPYTGILAVFSNLARRHKNINVFEDGKESRDFVYIEDVVEATTRCLDSDLTGVEAINVGSGVSTTVLDVSRQIVEYFDSSSQILISGAYRQGDIRHNIADLTKAHGILGFVPKWSFVDGIRSFLDWANNNVGASDDLLYEQSLLALKEKGLMKI